MQKQLDTEAARAKAMPSCDGAVSLHPDASEDNYKNDAGPKHMGDADGRNTASNSPTGYIVQALRLKAAQ
jgi:hypothetical protein